MSKYANGVFFASPYSNISPPATSFDMARSASRDSTISSTHYYPTSHPMSRTSSTNSYTHHTSIPMRRTSSASSSQSTWIASPYRSCLNRGVSIGSDEPSSYLSDDDLLCISGLPVTTVAHSCLKKPERKEMTTEEQIEYLRDLQEREVREQKQHRDSSNSSDSPSRRSKTVRFEPEIQRKRPSVKRRSTACRNSLRTLNGPM